MNKLALPTDFVAQREIAVGEILTTRPALEKERLPATGVHRGAIAIALGASGVLLLAAWAGFAGGETSLVLAIVTVLLTVFFGCFVGGAAMGRDMTTPDRQNERTFAEFLEGDVDIATGRISGREACLQIVMLPIALMLGGIAIIAIALWTA